jgi:hypothetical protein
MEDRKCNNHKMKETESFEHLGNKRVTNGNVKEVQKE